MDKKEFYDDIRKDLKLFYPEKTNDEINRMIDKSYVILEQTGESWKMIFARPTPQ